MLDYNREGDMMNKAVKMLIVFIMALFILPIIFISKVYASSTINEIRITSDTTYAQPGNLTSFTASTETENIEIAEYGSNTHWSKWENGYSSWHGFGTDAPSAVVGVTHYAMTLQLNLNNGYTFSDNVRIVFNGNDVTNQGHTLLDSNFDWGGYLYIDLGTATTGNRTVTFNSNGGSNVNSQTIANGILANQPDNPTNGDLVFDGWYQDEFLTVPFSFSTPIIADITLYAKWVSASSTNVVHTIFFGEGGVYNAQYNTLDALEIEKQGHSYNGSGFFTVTAGNSITLTAVASEGYHFDGWYRTHEENGSEWVRDELISNDVTYTFVPNSVTPYLMPVFVLNNNNNNNDNPNNETYTVAFNSNGGSQVNSINNIVSGSTINEPAAPTKDNLTFGGWYENQELTIPFSFNNPITNNVTLYAKWNYHVSFQATGEHQLQELDNHLSVDGQIVDLRNSNNVTVR